MDSLTKLREAIADADRAIESHCAAYECGDAGLESAQRERAVRDRSTALAAVEQEMAELREAKERVSEYVAAEWNAHAEPMFAELRELRRDRQRLDWLAANGGNILVHDSESGPFGFSSRRTRDSEWRTYTTLRAAIDGASACERLDALLNESHG